MLAVWAIFSVSLVPIPLVYILNTQTWMKEPVTVLCVGVALISLVLLGPYFVVRREKNPDFILYVMSIFMLSSVVDMVIALEGDGYISGLMTFYMLEGEVYLWTAYGSLMNYWDAVVHYGCCLWILYCVNNGKSYRKVGLFWTGSFLYGVTVTMVGSVIGKFELKYAIVLNIPYILIPIWIGHRLLQTKETQNKAVTEAPSQLLDLMFIGYFIFAAIMDILRGFIVLGCKLEYEWDHEPYLNEPGAFSRIQMLLYMMYFVPFYCCAVYGLVYKRQSWLADWALLYAGAAAQGQFVHTMGSVHPRTEPEFLVPDRPHSRNIFWMVNILLFVGPLLFAARENTRINKRQQKLE